MLIERPLALRGMEHMTAHFPIHQVAADAPGNGFLVSGERVVVALDAAYGIEVPPTLMEKKRVIFDVFAGRRVAALRGIIHKPPHFAPRSRPVNPPNRKRVRFFYE
jgi:hypothetical protein